MADQPAELAEAKRAIRREKIRWRSSLPVEEAVAKCRQITANLKTLPEYTNAATILFYVSAKPNEVDTHQLIREGLAGSVRVLVPVTDFERNELIIAEIRSVDELVRGRFGLLEPRPDALRSVDPCEANVVIVPGVAFDRQCRRVGFGGGYYDRLLSTIPIPSIALCYEGQLVDRVPVGSNDAPVDILVTETTVYRRLK